MKDFFRKLRRRADVLFPVAVLILGMLCLLYSRPAVQQAGAPIPMKQTFSGEYSWDGETWYPLEGAGYLSALEGDLHLRGHLKYPVEPGSRMYYYRDHIGEEIYVNGELLGIDIIVEMQKIGIELQPAMCSRGWSYWYLDREITPDMLVEIRLSNPHSFGNDNAYMDFLSTMYCTTNTPDFIADMLQVGSRPYLAAGVILGIMSIMLLGSAMGAAALRAPVVRPLVKLGLLTGFTGTFLLFDTVNLTFWSENNILNTYAWHISMMYAVYFLGVHAKDELSGRARKVAAAALAVSAAVNAGMLLASFSGMVLMYDTLFFWEASQIILCPVMILCCAGELFRGSRNNKPALAIVMVVFASILADILGNFNTMYSSGNLSKLAFGLFLLYTFLMSVRNIITDHMASIRAKKLESELEESRIAIMLSQIQPHFLFNVLGTLRGLCREDPEQAWIGLGDFSSYLRGNMNALTNAKYIHFDDELRHIEAYLRLEKMRLGDRLSIVYDIQERDFCIPPLTMQPLVENAVKHGIFYRQSGGTVIIRSDREGDRIRICVEDNGVGFDAENPAPEFENHTHVGLANVRNRIAKMLDGTLTIESRRNEGTTVTVDFPIGDNGMKGAQ